MTDLDQELADAVKQVQATEAVDGGVASAEVAPYVPRAVHCSRGEFEARGAEVLA